MTQDSQDLVDRSDVVILSVRPADWSSIAFSADGKLVVSVVTGVALADLVQRLQTERYSRSPQCRGRGVQIVYALDRNAEDNQDDRAIVHRIFAACGMPDEVGSEEDIDYFTGLSGTGPAFPALLAAAMMKDAIARGIDPELARRAVTTVLIGSGRLLESRSENPIDTLEKFVQYRGITTAAIEAMRSAGFNELVAAGLSAALERSG